MADKVLAIAGAVIGYYIPGVGPALGFAIGSLAGAALFPPKIDGPHTRNLASMNGSYGAMLPILYGTDRVTGSLIDEDPAGIQEVGSTQGGKGGPSVTTFAYYGWFAVALCEGPITGIRKIWANRILIYDVSSTASGGTIANSNTFAANYLTVYLGTTTQNQDPTMQSWHGAGNVSAYRGTAYLVFRGLPLANFANMKPSIEAEVVTVAAVTTPITKLWENDSTSFPLYPGGSTTGKFVGIPTGISGSQVRIYDRNAFLVGGGTAGNDGNTYILALSNGSVQAPVTPNSFESAIQTNNLAVGGPPKFGDAGTYYAGLIMPHAAGNCGVYSTGIGATDVILQSPTRSGILGTGPAMWVEDYATGTLQTDVIASLSTPPGLVGTWRLYAVFPCADWQHVCAVTYDGTNTNAWLHILSVGSDYSVAEIARYNFYAAHGADAFAQVSGFFNSNGYTASSTWNSAMLESNLSAVWLTGSGGANILYRFAISGGIVTTPQNFGSPFTGAFGANTAMFADNGLCLITDFTHYALFSVTSSSGQITLSDIVSGICQRVGLQTGQLNVTGLTDQVYGFKLDRQMTARAAIEAITPAWWFDGVESDGQLKFVHRSAAPLATITLDDMGADTSGKNNASPLQFVRGSEMELPSQLNLTYYAVGADYQPGVQYARRLIGLESNNIQSIDTAAVMDDTQAAVAAAIIMWDTIAGRVSFKFSTSYKWAQYEPTDILTIQTNNESYLARCTRKTEGAGKIDWEFTACAPVYTQSALGGAISSGQIVGGASPTTAIIMDIPPLRDPDGAADNLYVAMYGETGWPGGTLYKSSDGGVTFVAGVSMGTLATVGRATTTLGAAAVGGNMFDEGNTVTITILSGQTLSSTSELSVLNGANVALLGKEIFQFKNAVLTGTDTYVLSGLLRGRFGTEGFTHSVGESFVLLSSPGVIAIQAAPTSDIGQPRIYDAVTQGQPLPTGQQQTITEQANTLVCFSPVHLNAGGAGYYNDIVLTWIRRNRINWQWLPLVDVPMSEASEAYLVSIFSGASVVRTISVSGAGVHTATYTLAQQITDFGGSGLTSITFGVQQISAITGPGVMAKATIALAPQPYVPVTYTKTMTATQASTASLSAGFITPKVMTATQASSATLSTTFISGSGTTWDPAKTQSNNSLSNANLTLSSTAGGANSTHGTQSTTSHANSSGKYYVEFTVDASHAGAPFQNEIGVGICDSACAGVLSSAVNWTCGGWDGGYLLLNGGVNSSGTGTYGSGDVIGLAIDMSGSSPSVSWYKNNVLLTTASSVSGTGPWFIFGWAISATGTNAQLTANFGATAFTYTPPAGYTGGW